MPSDSLKSFFYLPFDVSPGETDLKTLVDSLRTVTVSGLVVCGLLLFGMMIPIAGCGSTEVDIAPVPPLSPPVVPEGQMPPPPSQGGPVGGSSAGAKGIPGTE